MDDLRIDTTRLIAYGRDPLRTLELLDKIRDCEHQGRRDVGTRQCLGDRIEEHSHLSELLGGCFHDCCGDRGADGESATLSSRLMDVARGNEENGAPSIARSRYLSSNEYMSESCIIGSMLRYHDHIYISSIVD